ncbi:MAG: hypothetical protein HXY19_08510 [Thermoanaerobaculaceae bacterium]|nr:hypothetical protein [Thermoanaerobaculaceae bacterium]
MSLLAPAALAHRFLDPLNHPLSALAVALLPAAAPTGGSALVVVEAALRLVRLLLAL